MSLNDEEQTELLQKVRDIHAAITNGIPVTMTSEDRAAIVDDLEQRLDPKLQSSVRNAMFTLQLNVPIPAGIATFSPKPPTGS